MSTLPKKVYNLSSFQRQLEVVIKESVASQFNNLCFDKEPEIQVDWNNILSCASVLASSDESECLDAALRVAQHCLNSTVTTSNQKIAAGVLLERLTNKPALKLALDRHLLPSDFHEDIPTTLQFESIRRDLRNSILTKDHQLIPLNRFQQAVYDASKEAEVISVSAPTSAGKSFIMSRIVLDLVIKPEKKTNVLYVVPTRALVNQVEDEFRELLKDNSLDNVYLSSVPQLLEPVELYNASIFVFTQERLHWFRAENPEFPFNYLIVDEAQKIEDGYRGILLQQKIEDIVKDFPEIKVFFSSPFTANPSLLLELAGKQNSKMKPVEKDFVSVNQNLIFVSQKPRKPKEWTASLWIKNNLAHLGDILLNERPDPRSKVLPMIAYSFANKQGGNIIYANSPSEAEKISVQLYEMFDQNCDSDEILQLIKLVRKVIHPRYKLAQTLKRRIAFHYGNMPHLVREEIERLFKIGELHYLVCTSTLLEGVNLPAKNIFIKNPKRGLKASMTATDFWNLAGRAGRWGKEFQGNVICIEPEQWENTPTGERIKQKITKAINKVSIDELLKYIQSDTPRSIAVKNPNLEYALTYYYSKQVSDSLKEALPQDVITNQELVSELENLESRISIPDSILLRNPGISPIAQQNLLNFFRDYKYNIEELIPVYPEIRDAAENSYKGIINLISLFLTGEPEEISFARAILVVSWMKGLPLPVLIDRNFKYWVKKDKSKSLDTVIRETMDEIETYARFKFAKYSSCYIDLLSLNLKDKGKFDLVELIPQLNNWLEYGVSQETQVSLISLGISRPTAIALSDFTKTNLSREECINWLREKEDEWGIELLGLPIAMINEIREVYSQWDKTPR